MRNKVQESNIVSIYQNQKQAQTMSSLDIAELTDKAHKKIIRDIRVMFVTLYAMDYVEEHIPEEYKERPSEWIRENALEILKGSDLGRAQLGLSSYTNNQNKQQPYYNLNHEHTMTLITGYDVVLRNRVIKRWQELEAQQTAALPNFTNASAAARAWADEHDARLLSDEKANIAESKFEEAKPKVLLHDTLMLTGGNINLGEFTNLLWKKGHIEVGKKRLFKFLRLTGILKNDKDIYGKFTNLPQQRYLELGWFEVIEKVAKRGQVHLKTYITPKGQPFQGGKLLIIIKTFCWRSTRYPAVVNNAVIYRLNRNVLMTKR